MNRTFVSTFAALSLIAPGIAVAAPATTSSKVQAQETKKVAHAQKVAAKRSHHAARSMKKSTSTAKKG